MHLMTNAARCNCYLYFSVCIFNLIKSNIFRIVLSDTSNETQLMALDGWPQTLTCLLCSNFLCNIFMLYSNSDRKRYKITISVSLVSRYIAQNAQIPDALFITSLIRKQVNYFEWIINLFWDLVQLGQLSDKIWTNPYK